MNTISFMPSGRQIYIFDQDRTLYQPGKLTDRLFASGRKWFCDNAHPPVREHEYMEKVVSRYPHFPEGLCAFGLSLQRWQNEVQSLLIDAIPDLLDPDPVLAQRLSELQGEKYVVSLSSPAYSSKILDVLGVNSAFNMVINPVNGYKGVAYQAIMEQARLPAKDIVVVGDCFLSDLEPARQRGMRTILVSNGNTAAHNVNSTVSSIHEFLEHVLAIQET